MKQGKGQQHFAKRMHWSQQTPSSKNTREDSTHGHHQMFNTETRLIKFFSAKDRETIDSAKTRLGADCISDDELCIAKFKLNLKKVEKTTRPFRHDLHQIAYDYTVEVRNRFKDLIECLMNCGMRFMTQYKRQGSIPSPWKRNAKVGSQETPGVTGKFGLGMWNEAGQRLIEFYQENALVIANTLF